MFFFSKYHHPYPDPGDIVEYLQTPSLENAQHKSEVDTGSSFYVEYFIHGIWKDLTIPANWCFFSL